MFESFTCEKANIFINSNDKMFAVNSALKNTSQFQLSKV